MRQQQIIYDNLHSRNEFFKLIYIHLFFNIWRSTRVTYMTQRFGVSRARRDTHVTLLITHIYVQVDYQLLVVDD